MVGFTVTLDLPELASGQKHWTETLVARVPHGKPPPLPRRVLYVLREDVEEAVRNLKAELFLLLLLLFLLSPGNYAFTFVATASPDLIFIA